MSKFDLRELRNAFGTFPTGVTVVTTISKEGNPVGFTANSYTSVSLDPPLILVCPAKSLTSYSCYKTCEYFAVNILAEGQQDISNIFASSKEERFSQIQWTPDARGCPLIEGAAVSLSCNTYRRTEAGDHDLLIGEVNSFITSGEDGLGYSNKGYFNLGQERRAAMLKGSEHTELVGVIIEHDGHVLLEKTGTGFRPLQTQSNRTGSLAAISDKLSHIGIDIEFGPVYSIFDDKNTGEVMTYYRGTSSNDATFGLGQYIPVEQLDALNYTSSAVQIMMGRYSLERQAGIFGLYIGDDTEGEIHMLGEGY